MHVAANPKDRCGDTEVRHLKSGNCHCLEENKATNTPAGFSQLTMTTPITVETSRSTCNTCDNEALVAVGGYMRQC